MKNELAKAGAALIAAGAVSLVQGQPFGACPIGYVVEGIPFPHTALYFNIAENGIVIADNRMWEPGVGEIIPPEGFRPYAVNSNGLMAGSGADGRFEVRTHDTVLASFDEPGAANIRFRAKATDNGWVLISGSMESFVVSPDLVMRRLEVPDRLGGFANSINSHGQACGWFGGGTNAAFWDSDGTFYEIPIPDTDGEAMDIDDSGLVLLNVRALAPALWSLDGGFRHIEPSGEEYNFHGWSMNQLGNYVGWAGPIVPWVWTGSHYSLMNQSLVDSDGWHIQTTYGINDAGQICGHANYNGELWLYIAHPVGLCGADITTTGAPIGGLGSGVPDGEITATDLSFFVNGWIVGDSVGDVTTRNAPEGDPMYGEPDGIVTAADIQYYVNMWISGCSG